MKKFTETYKIENKVSLEGLEKQVQEKLKGIDGQIIDECCCDCCCKCDAKCCAPCPDGSPVIPNYPFKYYNEQEIIKKLETDVTVQNLLEIIQQFNCGNRFSEIRNIVESSPLYFEEKLPDGTLGSHAMYEISPGLENILNSSRNLSRNKAVYAFIGKLIKENGLSNPVAYSTIDGRNILYFIKYTGTNGKEGSIKNSLLEIYETLNRIGEHPEVSSTNVSHVSIDAADDTYAFLIRIGLDRMFVLNSTK